MRLPKWGWLLLVGAALGGVDRRPLWVGNHLGCRRVYRAWGSLAVVGVCGVVPGVGEAPFVPPGHCGLVTSTAVASWARGVGPVDVGGNSERNPRGWGLRVVLFGGWVVGFL